MNKTTYEKVCEYCNKEFIARKSSTKYCSVECNREADKRRKRQRTAERGTHDKAVCEWCEKEYEKIQYKSKYCSRECSIKAYNFRAGRSKRDVREFIKCKICEKQFLDPTGLSMYCSDQCKDRAQYIKKHPDAKTRVEIHEIANAKKVLARAKAEEYKQYIEKCRIDKAKKEEALRIKREAPRQCTYCRMLFVSEYPDKKYCSETCKRNAYRRRHPGNERIRKRKRYEGITVDNDISLIKLAEMQRNQCQICGLLVDWNDRTKEKGTVICGDMYPSIDHIKPISLGGLHEWSNVQLAHRVCNYRKSNKYIGESCTREKII